MDKSPGAVLPHKEAIAISWSSYRNDICDGKWQTPEEMRKV